MCQDVGSDVFHVGMIRQSELNVGAMQTQKFFFSDFLLFL